MILSALALSAATILRPREISAPGPQGELKGTFQPVARAKAPVVLIVPGSGPTDRDGNSPLGIKAAPYRLLAEGLAQQGVASVRIDKRGMFGSAGAIPDPNDVTIGAYAGDVMNWIAVIRAKTGARCVWVLGHSEGALVALVVAQDRKSGICGLILLAGAGRPLGTVLMDQLRANPANAPLLPAAEKAVANLSAGKRVDPTELPQPLLPLFHPSVQGFLIDAFGRDPARLIATVRKPILILQGDRDIQVGVDDAKRLAAAQPSARLQILADTNHVLKTVTRNDRQANVITYTNPDLPLAAGVVGAIVTFLKRRN